MNCRYVQSRLSAYLDCELSGQEQQQIRSHLEQCIECSLELESLRSTKKLLRQMPVVIPARGPEQVLLRIRQATPAPRRTFVFRWGGRRWWHYAGGFALVASFLLWNQSELTSDPATPNALSPVYLTGTSPVLSPTFTHDLFSTYRPTSMMLRRQTYSVTEPTLMPNVIYPVDPTLGYQPVSHWNTMPVEPKIIETVR